MCVCLLFPLISEAHCKIYSMNLRQRHPYHWTEVWNTKQSCAWMAHGAGLYWRSCHRPSRPARTGVDSNPQAGMRGLSNKANLAWIHSGDGGNKARRFRRLADDTRNNDKRSTSKLPIIACIHIIVYDGYADS